MLSQFFILSSRGDTLAFRDYRGDVVRGTPEIFFRRVNTSNSTPIFSVEGTNFIYIRQSALYFVCTTKVNISPIFVLELLNKIASLCKDYCGVLSEDSLRMNFVLVYEILDEILDYGYPQSTSTGLLNEYVFNEPHIVRPPVTTNIGVVKVFGVEKKTLPGSARDKSVLAPQKVDGRNELYIDVLERITVILASNGHPLRSEIDGTISVRSFLAGNPEIRMSLSDNILFKDNLSNHENIRNMAHGQEIVELHDCCLHECVNAEELENNHVLLFTPSLGECTVMSYRVMREFPLPFRIHSYVKIHNNHQIGLDVTLKCDVPKAHYAVSIVVKIPVPKSTTDVSHTVSTAANTIEYKSDEKVVVWSIRKMTGGSEHKADLQFNVPTVTKITQEQIGPVSIDFEIPLYVSSKVQIKNLKVIEQNSMYTPMRWIRYITHSDSYVIRL